MCFFLTGAANDGGTDTDTALAVVAVVAGAGTAATSVSGAAACLRLRLRLRLPEPADAVAVDAVAILLGLSCVSHTCCFIGCGGAGASQPSISHQRLPLRPRALYLLAICLLALLGCLLFVVCLWSSWHCVGQLLLWAEARLVHAQQLALKVAWYVLSDLVAPKSFCMNAQAHPPSLHACRCQHGVSSFAPCCSQRT